MGRAKPAGSSWPFNSTMVVSSVQILPSFSLTWPKPRATSVSKLSQPSISPSLSVAPPPLASAQCDGFVFDNWLFSMSRTWSLPSMVLMFQVKVTRSRQ